MTEQAATRYRTLTWPSELYIPNQNHRVNVKMRDHEVIGMPLGVINTRRGFGPSSQTILRPNLAKLLTHWARAANPGFQFTSIQINKNTLCRVHVDKNNLGPSLLIGLGDYSGGELWVDGTGPLDAKSKWLRFDGNHGHATVPFAGTRYSFIFFTQAQYTRVTPSNAALTKALGFPWPDGSVERQEYPPAAGRVASAERKFNRWCRENGREVCRFSTHPHARIRMRARVCGVAGCTCTCTSAHVGASARARADSGQSPIRRAHQPVQKAWLPPKDPNSTPKPSNIRRDRDTHATNSLRVRLG